MPISNLILSLSYITIAVLAGPLPRSLDVSSASIEPCGSETSVPVACTTTAPSLARSSVAVSENAVTEDPAVTSMPVPSPSASSSVTLVTRASTTITARLNPPAFTMGVPSWFSSVETSLNHETSAESSARTSLSFSFSYDPTLTESTYSAPKTKDCSVDTVRSVSTTTVTLYTTVEPAEQPTGEASPTTAIAAPSFFNTEASSAKATAVSSSVTNYSSSTQTRETPEVETSGVAVSSPAQKDASATVSVHSTDAASRETVAQSTSHDGESPSAPTNITPLFPTNTAATSSAATTAFSFAHPLPDSPSTSTTSTSEPVPPSSYPIVHTKTDLPKVQSKSTVASSTQVESSSTAVASSTSSQGPGITIIPVHPTFITITVTQTDPGVTTTVTAS